MDDYRSPVVGVIPLLRLPRGHDIYDYQWTNEVLPCRGQLVRIPFRNKIIRGIIWDTQRIHQSPHTLRPISAVLTEQSALTPIQFSLCDWIARQSFCARSTVLRSMIRPGIYSRSNHESAELLKQRMQTRLVENQQYIPIGWEHAGTIIAQRIIESLKTGRFLLVLFPTYRQAQWMITALPKRYRSKAFIIHTNESPVTIRKIWRHLAQSDGCVVIGSRLALYAPWPQTPDIIIIDANAREYDYHEQNPRMDILETCRFITSSSHASLTMIGWPAPIRAWQWDHQGSIPFSGAIPKRFTIQRVIREKEYGWLKRRDLLNGQTTEEIETRIRQKQKAFVIVTQRSLIRRLSCRDCGRMTLCPECQHALVIVTQELLRCERCRGEYPVPPACERCGSFSLRIIGFSLNEWTESIRSHWNDAGWIDEMPSWNTSQPSVIVSTLRGLETLKTSMQLIIHPTLIILADADTILGGKGFQSTEYLYAALIAAESFLATTPSSMMIVETSQPQHPLWRQWATASYRAWYQQELTDRQLFRYPPASTIIRLTLKHRTNYRARDDAEHWHKKLSTIVRDHKLNAETLPPYQCYPARLGPLWQWCVAVKIHDGRSLEYLEELFYNEPTQMVIDRNIL